MLILVKNAGKLEGLNVLGVLGRSRLLDSLVLDVDGGLDGLDSGRSHGGVLVASVDVSKGSGCGM